MGIKQIEHYIEKHGVEKGTRIFNQLHKREETYSKSPYQRMTKEWFVWRYGEDIGISRFNEHVDKSRQSIENFIKRYGETEGRRKFEETMSKKNTVDRTYLKYGDAASDIIKERYQRSIETRNRTLASMTESEYEDFKKKKSEKSRRTKESSARGRSKFQIYCDEFEDGPERYGRYLQTIFKGIGTSREAQELFDSIVESNSWLTDYQLFYRGKFSDKEWFLSDKTGIAFYDFTVRHTKTILEYDGSRWHPTEEQVEQFGDDIMPVCGISFKEKFRRDQEKIERARRSGFDVFVIRSDMSKDEMHCIIDQFLRKTKENAKCKV